MWRIGGLRSRGGAVSARSRAPDGVHIARHSHVTSTASLQAEQICAVVLVRAGGRAGFQRAACLSSGANQSAAKICTNHF